MRVLLIDAYDSFIYIIAEYLQVLGLHTTVVRNDKITAERICGYMPDLLVLGPGPGHPKDAGYVKILEKFAGEIPILGVCLGHQAIGLAYGCNIVLAPEPRHGKRSFIKHDGKGCFVGLRQPFAGTRYHSLVIDQASIQGELVVSAVSDDDFSVMGVRHRTLPVEGLQFHPESIYTDDGLKIIKNFIDSHVQDLSREAPIYLG